MNNYISYLYFIRTLYRKRVVGRNVASNNLAIILIFLNVFSIFFIIEWLFEIKGIMFLSLHVNVPLAPIVLAISFIFYYISFIANRKKRKISIKQIRIAYTKSINYRIYYVIVYLFFTLSFLIISFILNH